MTDEAGFVRLQTLAQHDVVLLIPLLGESFQARVRGNDVATAWTVLIEPNNLPGLIP